MNRTRLAVLTVVACASIVTGWAVIAAAFHLTRPFAVLPPAGAGLALAVGLLLAVGSDPVSAPASSGEVDRSAFRRHQVIPRVVIAVLFVAIAALVSISEVLS